MPFPCTNIAFNLVRCNLSICLDDFPEYPPLLLVTSKGAASEPSLGHDRSFGPYNKEGTHNNKPYYVNDIKSTAGKRHLFYFVNGTWAISVVLGATPAMRTTEAGLDDLPIGAGGWEFASGGGGYDSDPDITVAVLGRILIFSQGRPIRTLRISRGLS